MDFLDGKVGDVLKKTPKVLGKVATSLAQVAAGQNPIGVVREKLQKEVKNDDNLTPEEKKFVLEEMDKELEYRRISLEDRKSARNMKGRNEILQFWFAVGFMGLYAAMIVGLFVLLFKGSDLAMGQFGITLISTISGQLSSKVNTIIDFLYGSSKDSESKIKHTFKNLLSKKNA